MDSAAKVSNSPSTLPRGFVATNSLRVFAFISLALLLTFSGIACTSGDAQALFDTAQFEERQNNPAHAKELYREIVTKYPNSDYAKKAQERLRELEKK